MSVKIRLARHGKKQSPYYYIVVADGRSPRDGKFIERLGEYNPTSNPATIKLNFDKALSWIEKGAQPTDTCRAILRYEGVLMKQHLLGGVKKGAFDEATAMARFEAWKTDKLAKIQAKREKLLHADKADDKKRMEAEIKVKAKRAEEIAERNAKLAAAETAKDEAEVEAEETTEVAEEIQAEEESSVQDQTENTATEPETPPTEA